MNNITRVIVAGVALIGLTFATGCKSDCEKSYENAISILEGEKDIPKEAIEKMKGDDGKKEILKECEKMSDDEVKCAIEAKDMAALKKCKKPTK